MNRREMIEAITASLAALPFTTVAKPHEYSEQDYFIEIHMDDLMTPEQCRRISERMKAALGERKIPIVLTQRGQRIEVHGPRIIVEHRFPLVEDAKQA